MQLTKLPLIGLIIGFVAVVIAVVVLVGVSIVVYKKVVKPAAQTNDLVTAGNDLLTTGQEAEAVILEVRDTGLNVKDYSEFELLLEVRPENRQPFQVRMTKAFYRRTIPLLQPGAKLKVKYDPIDTSQVAITSTPVPSAVRQKDSSQRFDQLKQLRNKGLITEDEYERKRQEILKEL